MYSKADASENGCIRLFSASLLTRRLKRCMVIGLKQPPTEATNKLTCIFFLLFTVSWRRREILHEDVNESAKQERKMHSQPPTLKNTKLSLKTKNAVKIKEKFLTLAVKYRSKCIWWYFSLPDSKWKPQIKTKPVLFCLQSANAKLEFTEFSRAIYKFIGLFIYRHGIANWLEGYKTKVFGFDFLTDFSVWKFSKLPDYLYIQMKSYFLFMYKQWYYSKHSSKQKKV